jgi:hypothetical protein
LRTAYVDSSCLVGIGLGEPGSAALATRLASFDSLWSSNLLEAEVRSALDRERIPDQTERVLAWVSWVLPARPLTPEIDRVLAAGLLKGADLWHVASALLMAPAADIAFLTLDTRQKEVAAKLGFAT